MQACTILPRSRPSTTTWPPGRRSTVTRAENAGRPRKPKRLARAARSLSLAMISSGRAAGPHAIEIDDAFNLGFLLFSE